jgi:hypothetical protein
MEIAGILISTKKLCVMRNIDMFKSLLKDLDKRRQSNQMDAGTRLKLLAAVVGSSKSIGLTDNPQ